MKKLFGIIAIALLFSFAGMESATADNWDVIVTWEDNCDDCVQVTGHEYYVCLRIWNTCTQTEAWANCIIKASGIYEHTFNVVGACTIDEGQQCFELTATVVKRCIVSQEIICQNSSNTLTKSCAQICYGELELNVDLY